MQYKLNHGDTLAIAKAIANLANELNAHVDCIIKMEQNLHVRWKGKAARAFFSQSKELRESLKSQIVAMEKLASTIQCGANSIQE